MFMFEAEEIRAIRKALDLNTTEFATRLGVTENCVRRWELGDRTPRKEHMRTLNDLDKEAKARAARELVA